MDYGVISIFTYVLITGHSVGNLLAPEHFLALWVESGLCPPSRLPAKTVAFESSGILSLHNINHNINYRYHPPFSRTSSKDCDSFLSLPFETLQWWKLTILSKKKNKNLPLDSCTSWWCDHTAPIATSACNIFPSIYRDSSSTLKV